MVAILLSTYNGEKYLAQQLDSLLNQSFKEFSIHIRDDGSTDRTLDIIKEYKSFNSNIHFYSDHSNFRKGPSGSFMWLLQNVQAEYYMFCDQDDFWFPNKIQISYDAICSEEVRSFDKPILIHTDLIVTDSNLNIVSNSLWANNKISPFNLKKTHLRLVNFVTGCTIIINEKAKQVALIDFDGQIMHDHWIAICIDSFQGKIISLQIPTLFYRQHGGNVIGSNVSTKKFSIFKRYFHYPQLEYSLTLYRVFNLKYKMNFFKYCVYRLYYYFTH